MAEVAKEHLLTAEQMAGFVIDGYVLFKGFIPDELNKAAFEEQSRHQGPARKLWEEGSATRAVFELPKVKGILQSLVGAKPVFDHCALHIVGAQNHVAQDWHGDSVIDARPLGFDVQAFYFCHDTPIEMGPTLVLPGSHMRRINTSSIARYKNIVGQLHLDGPAGTIGFLHHGIWHCAQPNYTDRTRYMFKVRLRPGEQQRNLFNTDGYDDPEIRNLFNRGHKAWQGNESRLEHIEHAKLWRYVVGNDSVDVSFEGVLTRMGI
ncbi:MAG TPA: phytanoyl-CoA dioxygenase family protein [Limnochordia bacterium]|nr:phytanoyl-CoA dioxygenase family protein [Limnochordia bacterium]